MPIYENKEENEYIRKQKQKTKKLETGLSQWIEA